MLLLALAVSTERNAEAQERDSGGSWEAGPASHTLLSLAVPGLGQHKQGKARKWAFAALEVMALSAYVERRRSGSALRRDYRAFAWEAGRVQIGARVDGDFDYYETLSKWLRSGAFDGDAGSGGIQPEQDPETFNGMIWARAQGIFLGGGGREGDPGFAQAIEYYEERAYGSTFLWDWSSDPEGRERLGDMISETDGRFRQATTAVGIVIANHVASAIDAYLSARGVTTPASMGFAPRRGGLRGLGWTGTLRVPVGRGAR